MRLRQLAIVLPCLFAAACATAPARPAKSTARPRENKVGCLDTLRAVDTVEAIVKLTVASADTMVKLPAEFADLFAEEFRSRFKPPPRLSLSVVMGSEPCDSLGWRCAGAELSVGSTAYVTAYNNGTLSPPAVVDATLTPSLVDSVREVLEAISRDKGVPWLGRIDSLPLVLTLAASADSAGTDNISSVFRTRLPVYASPFTYATMPRSGVNPRFPFSATIAGVGDTVALLFTVQADGEIAPESIDIVEASYRDFVGSVLDALAKTRYHPAHLGDCAVATRLKQRFVFRSAP